MTREYRLHRGLGPGLLTSLTIAGATAAFAEATSPPAGSGAVTVVDVTAPKGDPPGPLPRGLKAPGGRPPTPGRAPGLPSLEGVRDLLDLPGLERLLPRLELTAHERAALDRLIAVMPALAGQDGRFNRGDLPAILASLEGDLAAEVRAEIARRAVARIRHGRPGWRLRRMGVNIHLKNHYGGYLQMGLDEARERVRTGLAPFFERTGLTEWTVDDQPHRSLTLTSLRQFGKDARVLEGIGRRARERGLPTFTFPQGMGVEDLEAIKAGQIPPNGRLRYRS